MSLNKVFTNIYVSRHFDLRTPLTLFVISSHRPNENGQSKIKNKTGWCFNN